MKIYSVFMEDKFLTSFDNHRDAQSFINNCRLAFYYAGHFEEIRFVITEEYVCF